MRGSTTNSMPINLFPSPGSKARLAPHLVRLYPPHVRYVEPFAGGASCFWIKPRSGVEVLNDYDSDIVRTYATVRDMTSEALQRFACLDWEITPENFAVAQDSTDDPTEHAYRFIYLRRASFMARETTIARQRIGKIIPIHRHLVALHRRLQGTDVLHGDGLRLLSEMDTAGTFFFIDPPWPGYFGKWKHYTMEAIRDLADAVANIRHATWLWAEIPTLREELNNNLIDCWNVKEISMPGTGFGHKSIKRELLMSNYSLGD